MTQVYFAIVLIVSLVGWTELARVVRGKFLSHVIATLTLAIPHMILAETALSFIGLGMQAPAISWGVLLKAAQNLETLAKAPWILTPALAVVVCILSFNFVGDGVRDAADPYSHA